MDAVTLNVVEVLMDDVEVGRDAIKCDDPRRAKSGTRTFSVVVVVSSSIYRNRNSMRLLCDG